MFDLILWIILFAISVFLLVKGADYFTDSAEKLGLFFGIPSFIIGITIVALGTSIPELASSIAAVFQETTEIVIGDVVGSNIANILLVLGVAAVVNKRLKSKWDLIPVDLPLLIISVVLITLLSIDGVFSLFDGIISIVAYIIYIFYNVFQNQEYKNKLEKQANKTFELEKKKLDWKIIPTLILSGVLIYLGAKYTIISLKVLGSILRIPNDIIATFALSVGTSLPELVVSITAAKKGNSDMAIGNVIGSNIFNTFVVMGFPALITPLIITTNMIYFAIPFMIGTTVLFFFITQDNKISRWEGLMMLLLYFVFVVKLFAL